MFVINYMAFAIDRRKRSFVQNIIQEKVTLQTLEFLSHKTRKIELLYNWKHHFFILDNYIP